MSLGYLSAKTKNDARRPDNIQFTWLPFLLRFLWGISDVQPRPQHSCLSLAKALAHLTLSVYPEGSAATALASSQPTTLPKLYLGHNS